MEVASIQRRIEGEVIGSEDPGYDATRADMVWNQVRPDRPPDVIVRAKHEQDVVAALLARAAHGRDRRPGPRTAAIQRSISNRDLMRQLSAQALAFPVGHCPTVEASGFLLSGGIGWNSHHWGPACLNVESDRPRHGRGTARTRERAGERRPLLGRARGRSRPPRDRHAFPSPPLSAPAGHPLERLLLPARAPGGSSSPCSTPREARDRRAIATRPRPSGPGDRPSRC